MTTTPRTRRSRRRRHPVMIAGTLVVAAGLALTACGDDDDDATDTTTDVAPAATAADTAATDVTDASDDAATAAIEVTGAWARTSPMDASVGAAYLQITNGGEDDALTAAAVDESVAAAVEIHETRPVTEEDSMTTGSSTTGSGEMTTGTSDAPMMEMAPIERIEVPAGETVALEPGGYHIMLLDLAAPLELGDEIELTLTFEVAGEVVVTAVVEDQAP